MNYDFTELFKLEKLCRGAGWKVEVLDTYPKGKQLILYDGERRLDDVVICQGSHGANLGFLESFVLGDCGDMKLRNKSSPGGKNFSIFEIFPSFSRGEFL